MRAAYAHANTPSRLCLLKGILSTKAPEADSFLVEASKDTDPHIRGEAVRGIGRATSPIPDAAAIVVAALSDKEPTVVYAAINAVARLKPPPAEAASHLLRIRNVDRDDKWLSTAADEALAVFANEPAVVADTARRAAEAARPFQVSIPRGAERLPQLQCTEEWFASSPYLFVTHGGIAGRTVGGELGKGGPLGGDDTSAVEVSEAGEVSVLIDGKPLLKGEPVVVRRIVQSEGRRDSKSGARLPPQIGIQLNTVLKHNVTRGRGQFEHQSAEVFATFVWLPVLDCSALGQLWGRLFDGATSDLIQKMVAAAPSGVLVDEIAEGMTPAEVEGVLGPPERKAQIAGKDIYFYPRMKVTFRGGKVVDIE